MSGEGDERSDSEGGFALVVVLAFLLMAAAFTATFLAGARIHALVTRNTGQLTREKILLRGLIEIAGTRFFELYQNRDNDVASAVRCPAARPDRPDVIFRFQDHSGLIDLNAASAEVLAIGFESLAIKRDEAAALAAKAVRFRSVDDGQLPKVEQAPPRGGHKHALFERSAELMDLTAELDIAQEDFDQVFTVHSGTGTVDEAASQGLLLQRLGALKAGERFFIVSGVRRGAALTVEAELDSGDGREIWVSAVFAPSDTAGQARFLEPPSFRRSVKKTVPGSAGSDSACAGFFDPVLLEAIAKVTS
jgi:general secretion pathway protein K